MTMEPTPSYGTSFVSKVLKIDLQHVMHEIYIANKDTATDKEIWEKFTDVVLNDPDLNKAAVLHAAVNLLTAVQRPYQRYHASLAEKAADKEKIAKTVQETKRIIILDMLFPGTNKKIRDCTFAEVRKLGGVFTRLGKMGKPSQIIGDVVSDAQARKIMS